MDTGSPSNDPLGGDSSSLQAMMMTKKQLVWRKGRKERKEDCEERDGRGEAEAEVVYFVLIVGLGA